ncbi:hypothetical protein [Falsiroseomonas tokyonensis]|uniref:Uncharacterized protein n=1 Tax=Falsiroseomonas tokyonensis TaxID=430521 RepID=A0ABV7C0T5_9PROT|nr:hypothetical protein [Falsiroseomonas tokyonensis]MBU8540269.1 hypothetical protein [Falsiroseomonas tokyonensis]
MPHRPDRVAPALCLLLPALLVAPPALAQQVNSTPARICVQQNGAYVARMMVTARYYIEGGGLHTQVILTDESVPVGQQRCGTAPAGSWEVQVSLSVVGGRDACQLRIRPVVPTTITMRGTSLQAHCTS